MRLLDGLKRNQGAQGHIGPAPLPHQLGRQVGELHLLAARQFMDANPTLTRRTGVICCWNEFGEGSFIEPTKVDGLKYLEQIRAVFGTR